MKNVWDQLLHFETIVTKVKKHDDERHTENYVTLSYTVIPLSFTSIITAPLITLCLPAWQISFLLDHANWAVAVKSVNTYDTTSNVAFEITCSGGKRVILRIVDESEGPTFTDRRVYYLSELLQFPRVLRGLVLGNEA